MNPSTVKHSELFDADIISVLSFVIQNEEGEAGDTCRFSTYAIFAPFAIFHLLMPTISETSFFFLYL